MLSYKPVQALTICSLNTLVTNTGLVWHHLSAAASVLPLDASVGAVFYLCTMMT